MLENVFVNFSCGHILILVDDCDNIIMCVTYFAQWNVEKLNIVWNTRSLINNIIINECSATEKSYFSWVGRVMILLCKWYNQFRNKCPRRNGTDRKIIIIKGRRHRDFILITCSLTDCGNAITRSTWLFIQTTINKQIKTHRFI